MKPEEFLDHVTDENQTALSRLGSSKALYADTGGDLDSTTILTAVADTEYHAATTYQRWADSETHDDASTLWTETAQTESTHYDRVIAELDTDHTPSDPPPIHDHLRSLDASIDRVGAFIGRTIAATRSKEQITGYFVGQGDHDLANLFREFGDDLDHQLDAGQTLLDTLCHDETAWSTAATAATTTIQTAYDDYVDSLETMGVNPKPVC